MNNWYLIEYLKDDYFGNISVEKTDEIKAESPGQALTWAESYNKDLKNWCNDSDYKYFIRITLQ